MKSRHLLASSLGNILEWFDFGFFIFIAPVIGKHFFPTHDTQSASLAAFGVFAAGFICRPLGGIWFGHRGDRHGRGVTLRLSILLITLTTLLVGILPGYETIGILAPIIFVFLRMLQGFSIGGEYTGIAIYLAESVSHQKRGFFTSFALVGSNLGFLLATLTVIGLKLIFNEEALYAWAWRIPFILIGFLGLILFYARIKLLETPIHNQLKQSGKILNYPLLTALRFAPDKLLKIFGLTCMSATLYYIFFGYMPSYLQQQLDISPTKAFLIQSALLFSTLFLVPLGAALGDHWGRKKILLITAISMIFLIIPCFYLLNEKNWILVFLALSVTTLLCCLDQGNSLTTIVEHCPVDIRYSGIALAYNLGNAIFGGLAPLMLTLFIQQFGAISPAYYIIFMTSVTLAVILTLHANPNAIFISSTQKTTC